jgi:hypothetical protein
MRYFVAFLVAMALIFLLIALLFGGGKSKAPPVSKTLASYATTDADVQLTIDGPVNADQSHQAVQITVDSDNVTFEQLQGYDSDVVNTQVFNNTENAYANFLLALEHAGFTEGNNNPKLSDERGYCPLGPRYVFQLTQDGKDIERYWATGCGNPKTYQGNLILTLSLFQAQVPGYSKLVQNINLL